MDLLILLNAIAVVLIIYINFKVVNDSNERFWRIVGGVFVLAMAGVVGFYIAFLRAYSEGSQGESSLLEHVFVIMPLYGPSVITIIIFSMWFFIMKMKSKGR